MKNGLKSLVAILTISLMTSVHLQPATLTAVNETPTLDGIDTGDWTGDSIVTGNGVTMKAAYDGSSFYLFAQWNDSTFTEGVNKNQWRFSGGLWSQSGNEDQIAIMWDLGTTPQGAQCATMCHPPRMYTSEGTVDVWHWKATRSNPMGYSDDMYLIAIQDTTAGGETLLGDGGNDTYDDNSDGGPTPVFMANADPNARVDFLVRDGATLIAFDPYGVMTAHSVKIAVDWADSGWMDAATIAGYVHEIPDSSSGDVHAAGLYQSGVWTVELMRSLTTMGPNDDARDVQFDPANSYNFTVAIWDNSSGQNHMTDTTEDTLVFEITGIGDDETGPSIPLSLALSQNYPNPFNPSTSIRYTVPEGEDKSTTVKLQVFTVHGQLVRTLVQGAQGPGNYTVHWDGTNNSGINVPSGLYLYRLSVDDESVSKKMTLLK